MFRQNWRGLAWQLFLCGGVVPASAGIKGAERIVKEFGWDPRFGVFVFRHVHDQKGVSGVRVGPNGAKVPPSGLSDGGAVKIDEDAFVGVHQCRQHVRLHFLERHLGRIGVVDMDAVGLVQVTLEQRLHLIQDQTAGWGKNTVKGGIDRHDPLVGARVEQVLLGGVVVGFVDLGHGERDSALEGVENGGCGGNGTIGLIDLSIQSLIHHEIISCIVPSPRVVVTRVDQGVKRIGMVHKEQRRKVWLGHSSGSVKGCAKQCCLVVVVHPPTRQVLGFLTNVLGNTRKVKGMRGNVEFGDGELALDGNGNVALDIGYGNVAIESRHIDIGLVGGSSAGNRLECSTVWWRWW